MSIPIPEQHTLAEAMCYTSHHGLTRTDWPCPYHQERAERVREELRRMNGRTEATR